MIDNKEFNGDHCGVPVKSDEAAKFRIPTHPRPGHPCIFLNIIIS